MIHGLTRVWGWESGGDCVPFRRSGTLESGYERMRMRRGFETSIVWGVEV